MIYEFEAVSARTCFNAVDFSCLVRIHHQPGKGARNTNLRLPEKTAPHPNGSLQTVSNSRLWFLRVVHAYAILKAPHQST